MSDDLSKITRHMASIDKSMKEIVRLFSLTVSMLTEQKKDAAEGREQPSLGNARTAYPLKVRMDDGKEGWRIHPDASTMHELVDKINAQQRLLIREPLFREIVEEEIVGKDNQSEEEKKLREEVEKKVTEGNIDWEKDE